MGWILPIFLTNTVLPPLLRLRLPGLSCGWSTSPWTICGPASPRWRTNSKTWRQSQSNSSSATTRPTRPCRRSANAWHALKSRLKPITNSFAPSNRRADVKRLATITGLSTLAILCGSGCQNIKSLEVDFGGLDVEYFPSHPSQEEKSIFDFSLATNVPPFAMPASYPRLMPMSR